MRRDMEKVLVTRPRHGSWKKNEEVRKIRRSRPKEDGDNGGNRGSMKPKYPNWDNKQLNEFLNPLWRFLNSRVGKPWDKVYSEIRKENSGRSAVGAHIYQHLFDFVVINPQMIDNKPHQSYLW